MKESVEVGHTVDIARESKQAKMGTGDMRHIAYKGAGLRRKYK